MSLFTQKIGPSELISYQTANTASEFGTVITANSTRHVKGTYTELVNSTNYTSYGIMINFFNSGVASTRTNILVDIALGSPGSEVVIIENLMAGFVPSSGATSTMPCSYYFPITIPNGYRISARSQANVSSDTISAMIHLFAHQNPGQWYGSRVTTYGANTSISSGVSISPGNNTWSTVTDIVASATNPVRYLQLGVDLYTNATGATQRGMIQLYQGSNLIANNLPFTESTTLESISNGWANFILSNLYFNMPAGSQLRLAAQRNAASATRGWILYGVD